ncbi:carbohydrate-binding protein [Hymenobacter arizonensis]|uniref:Por secretion system C-terminal sorting domain-containing protein n=1 Tax=Hymenobacter arizonensis TaxID=1227077 RepID=A0A1I6BKT9_HYMAR|nr:carbohydrate-binding protein [Hymenobacter arizonensis]SFQ81540.1 Por secretion system C-terminal sorting domain-containing protein [Hymenobacter arizonensis]
MKRVVYFVMLSWLSTTVAFSQAISPYLAGQNAWLPTALGTQVFNGQLDRLWPLVKQSQVKMIRIGGNGANSNLVTNQQYIAQIDSIRKIGAEPMVQVAEGRGRFTAAQAAQVVNHVNITMGRNIKYWIIGNEPDLNNASHPNPTPVAGVEAYIKAFASAMKAVDPTILIVGPENASYNSYYPALVGGANDVTGKDANGRYYIDIISFHTYPFAGTQTRAQVINSPQNLANTVTNLLGLMANANALHNRTGAAALRWALTEFNVDYANPTANTVEGVGVHSFLNGQYWAEVFGVGMKYEGVSMQPWSIHEGSGARGVGDLGYIDGNTASTFKPRSAFWHEMLVSENLHGTNLNATDNQALVKVLSSTDNGTTAVMVLNESDVADYDFTVQLNANAAPGTAALKINVPANINNFYTDKIFAQSTLVLLFNSQGALTSKIVYSLQHAQNTMPPTYLKPGQTVTLAAFSANKTLACVAPETVMYTASVLGDFTTLDWNFGAGATPATGTGKGPFTVNYATAGTKDVSLTLVNPDTTIVVNKPGYLLVSSCIRTPFRGSPAVLPGVVKAVEYDFGGQGAAYNDSDVTNQGFVRDATVPRGDEAVDTENGDGGLGNIGYTAPGEWVKYSVNVLRSGLYKVTARVASGTATGGVLRLSVNDVDKTGLVTVANTGGFGVYQDLVINNVYLEASPNATLKLDIVGSGFNFSKLTFEEQPAAGIVVNRIYNATNEATGQSDAVELLVVKDHQDIRGLIIKDFEASLTTDVGGKYQFNNQPLWQDLRIGTTIVLRKLAANIAGYTQDLDPTDFKLDLALENPTLLTFVGLAGHTFNLTSTDMVLLKTGDPNGVTNAVHAFASNVGTNPTLYAAVTGPKLASTLGNGGGTFQYPLSAAQTTADYDGVKAAASTSTSFNWGNGFGDNNIAYIAALRASIAPPAGTIAPGAIVVNRVYNGSNDGDGRADAVELLVTQDHLDIRGLLVKDFESNITADNGGKYRFNNTAFWQDMRAGTTIVLRKLAGPAGYAQDTDASDFTIDLLLENATYLANESAGNVFNITQFDMVMIKAGVPGGVAGAIHAFATRGGGNNGVPSAIYTSVTSPKLVSPNTDAGGDPSSFHYPLNPDQLLSDFNGAKSEIYRGTVRNWGYGFGPGNEQYIQSLRNALLPAPTALVATATNNSIALTWADNAATESGFEVVRSLDGVTYTLVATLAPNATTYSDPCLRYATRYYYKVRTTGEGLFSSYAAANTNTADRTALNLPTLTAGCTVTATAPTAPDYCGGTVTATTTDPTTYSAQGSFTIMWSFAYGDGSTSTAIQSVVVKDLTPPTVRTQNISVRLVAGSATVTAATVDNGSTDACGLQTLTLDKTSFDCSNTGANTVLLTVTDVNGNRASAPATVTVIGATPVPAIAVSKTSKTFTGLDATTLAIGYGAQSVVLTASNSTSAAAATTYSWAPAAGLSNAQVANPAFAPTAAGTYTFTVLATNEFGCTASASVTITVLDVRCGDANDKVLVCQNGSSLCIAASAVPAQLGQAGSRLATCGPVARKSVENVLAGAVFETYPNPVTSRAVVHFRPAATAAAQVQVFNALGQVVATLYDAVAEAGRDYEVTLEAASLPAGIYTCRLVSNGHVKTQRLVVIK